MSRFLPPKILAAVTLGLLVAAGVVALQTFGVLRVFELNLQNWLYAWQLPSRAPSAEIVLVTIDDRSLADPALGRWQEWRRAYFATAIQNLAAAGARVIGVDVTFSEPSRVAGDDDLLAEAIAKVGQVVLVGRTDAATGPVLPLAKFAGAAGVGFANLTVGEDNVVRQSPRALNFGTAAQPRVLPAFALALAEQWPAWPGVPLPSGAGVGDYFLNFFGPPGSFARLSFTSVFHGSFAPSAVAGKVVLIGVTPADLRDLEAVPVSFGTKMAGVEIHANALQTILSGQFLTQLPRGAQVGLITLLAVLAALLAIAMRTGVGVLALALLGSAYVFAAHLAFAAGYLLSLFYPLLAAVLTFAAVLGYRLAFADRAGRALKAAFRHYLAPELVEQIAADPARLHLGGAARELTIFFSDLENFTQLAERLPPPALVKLLNIYLGKMTEIVLAAGGTLDKYIGDAVMAFWGAPLPVAEPAMAACRAALAQQVALQQLHRAGQLPGHSVLRARMGIHTGTVVVGNMGSAQRFNYTAMGDAVNLASRLEGVNKCYGTSILISESTYQQAQAAMEAREIDTICVKGKAEAVTIYELVALRGGLSAAQKAGFPHYAAGLAAYRQRDFAVAERHLRAALAALPHDGPSATLLARALLYQRTPPPATWDGVFILTTK